MVTGVAPSPPRFLLSFFIAHRVQQSHCSSIFHRVLLTHALALSASQFVHKKKPQRVYTSMHSVGLELTKLTYTRLEDNLIRHQGCLAMQHQPHWARGQTRMQAKLQTICKKKKRGKNTGLLIAPECAGRKFRLYGGNRRYCSASCHCCSGCSHLCQAIPQAP